MYQDLIKEAQEEAAKGGDSAFSPRTTSLTVQRVANKKEGASERFFKKLEEEVRDSRMPASISPCQAQLNPPFAYAPIC